MNTSPHQVGSSPRETYRRLYGSPGAHYAVPTDEHAHSGHFEAAIGLHQGSGALHDYPDSFDPLHGAANDVDQYRDLGLERQQLHDRPSPIPPLPFAARNDQELLRGLANYTTQSNSGNQVREEHGAHSSPTPLSHTTPQHQFRPAGTNSALMQSSPQISIEYAVSSHEAAPERQTKYEPFQHRFYTSDQARDHRRRGTRFDRTPYCDPDTDTSIADIENNRVLHVMRIYNAMTSGEAAKDNRGSIAMKRWVLDAHYPPDLVEAYAHKVFDCLLLQAKEGFRGWVHNDYVADERKGDDIDKDVDCAGRLENVILALEQEKTICEDVMNSACQIRMFVNAPRAYANRKHQNRVGNSKRGRTKDTPDPNPKGGKMARTGSKRTRARSTTTSDMPGSRDTTPQTLQPLQRTPLAPPYYTTPAAQQISPSPMGPGYVAARTTTLHRPTMSAHRSSFGQHSIPAMSPPTSSPRLLHVPQSHVPRMTTEPPQLQSPFMSPPPPIPLNYSAPASPDDVKHVVTDAGLDDWKGGSYGEDFLHTPWIQDKAAIDPALSQWGYSQGEETASSTIFGNQPGQYVNLSDIESQRTGCHYGCATSAADMCRRDHGLLD